MREYNNYRVSWLCRNLYRRSKLNEKEKLVDLIFHVKVTAPISRGVYTYVKRGAIAPKKKCTPNYE